MTAHSIASTFDRGGLALAGVAATLIEDRRTLQRDLDEEQAVRNLSAAQRAVYAVERQRQALVAAQAETAALRDENARLKDELARMRSRALEAEGRLVRLGKAAAARRAA